GRQTYQFLCLLELLRHYQETQADKKGSVRKVWLFEFRIHSSPDVIPIGEASSIMASLLAESRKSNPLTTLDREVTESIESEFTEIPRAADVESIRAHLLQIPPLDFEHFIKTIMERSGFVSVSVTRASGDGGVDLD